MSKYDKVKNLIEAEFRRLTEVKIKTFNEMVQIINNFQCFERDDLTLPQLKKSGYQLKLPPIFHFPHQKALENRNKQNVKIKTYKR